jgi:pilus assembly protein Flp/PilA
MERRKMKALLTSFAKNESGATAIEHGLIALFIGVAIVATVTAIGGQLNTIFGTVATDLGG